MGKRLVGFGRGDDVATEEVEAGVKKEPEFIVELPQIKVNITPEAHKKLFEYVHTAEGEISGMGLVRQDNDEEFTIYDVFILKQEASGGYTALDPHAIAKKVFELHKEGKYKDLSLWWHSHCDFETFWSGTDTGTCDRLANNKFLVSIVLNKKQEARCRIDLYKPLRITVDDVIVSMPEDRISSSEKVKKEIGELVKQLVYQWGEWGKVVQEPPVEDPYLFKGTRIVRKAGSVDSWWTHSREHIPWWQKADEPEKKKKVMKFKYPKNKRFLERLHKRGKNGRKGKRSPLELALVVISPGNYKSVHYSYVHYCYVDEQYQTLYDERRGYVIEENKHTAIVNTLADAMLLRVPKDKLEVREDE